MKPLQNRIVLEIEKKKEVSKGGVFIPETAEMHNQEIGVVLRVGSECKEVKAGDRVILGVYSGTNITTNEGKFLVLKETDVYEIHHIPATIIIFPSWRRGDSKKP